MKVPFQIVFENGTEAQKKSILVALEKAHEVLGSEEFKRAVLEYRQPDGTLGFYQAKMTNQEVYDRLMSTPWKYSVSFYYKKITSARAYVNPGDPTVNLNWAKMSGDKPSTTGSTLVHENTHLKGFKHDYDRTEKRPFSVPYAVGLIVQLLMDGESVTPKPSIQVTPKKSIWSKIKGFFNRIF